MKTGKGNTYKSTCSYCGVGCGIVIHKDNSGKISIEGDKENPVNKGMLCSKGMNLHYTLSNNTDRLLYPQLRTSKNEALCNVSWDEGLDYAAAKFKSIINEYGPDAVGFYVSGQCLTEEYYIINKLIKGFIGSNNIDTNSRLCMSSAVAGYKIALGEDSVPCSYEDIELADCFYVAGANPAWCHPILWRRVEAHKQANPDIKIIVVDPRKTQTCSIADIHLQINPGTDIVLNHAIGRQLIEMGCIDEHFILNYTNGYTAYSSLVFQKTLIQSASICGVDPELIKQAAEYIGQSKGFISMWTMGLNQSVVGVNKNLSLINLNLITGKIGKPGNGPFSLTGQPNAMGGREVGGLSNLLPAHRILNNPNHRKEVQEFWGGTTISEKPGLTATEMFDALAERKMKAIWIVCTNPLVSIPDSNKVEKALSQAEFVIVQDISNLSDTVKYADLVLPAAGWAEKEGTMTNSERRISHIEKAVDPPGIALPDVEIIAAFARKMGYDGFDYKDASEIYAEHCCLTEGTKIDISGLNYNYLKSKGTVQWPFPKGNTSGTSRLFTDNQFYTSDKKANISACPDINESENTSYDFPLILTTGRIRDQWHTMTKTGKVNKLNQHIPTPYLEIHPEDAFIRGIKNDSLVEITNSRGNVRVKAKVTEEIKQGVVFLPMHWGKILNSTLNRANNLTNTLVDPISKEPDLKFSAVQVKLYKKEKQKIIIVGAGAGAFGFVKSYRAVNQDDEIVIFSKENEPFYNRVMLPDYVNREQSWEQLVKMQSHEEKEIAIKLMKGVSVLSIDRTSKTIIDNNNKTHNYDVLILATGSRPYTPNDVPKLKGIFSMRTRNDADSFINFIPPNGHVVVVGGGLLGLEMAASIKEIGMQVTLVHRSSKLMSKQLDSIGSKFLREEILQLGIDIIINEEIKSYQGIDCLESIVLTSGKEIKCQAVLLAIGTTPNIELAKNCGLTTGKGVNVNDYLQTSDENIYAIGEIAEHRGQLFGITAAAEEQADVLAKYLLGERTNYYKGSLSMNLLKVKGINLCSIGQVEYPEDDLSYEEIILLDSAKRFYKKCIVQNDILIGTILIGDKSEFIEFKTLIQNKIELGDKRTTLLRSGSVAEPVKGKLICSCNNVGEGNITDKIKAGCEDHKELCTQTGAGMGCGSCRPEVKLILEKVLTLAV